MAYSAMAIANYFLSKRDPITVMKLQKIIYFAHGWHLALYDSPLIDEQVQAWDYGPVIASVYHEFKAFGGKKVTRMGNDFDSSKSEIFTPRISLTDKQTVAFLEKIWTVYSKFTGIQLSNLTHEINSAWNQVRDDPENAGLRFVGMSNKRIKEDFYKRSLSPPAQPEKR